MSNIFKSNSRFAALADEVPANKEKKNDKKNDNSKQDNNEEKINSFKSEKIDNRFNSFKNDNSSNDGFRDRRYNRRYDDRESQKYREQCEAELKAAEEFKKQEEERQKQEALKIENFPDLFVQNNRVKTEQPSTTVNYLDKIKNNNTSDNKTTLTKLESDLENLKPGWVMISRDSETGNTVFNRNPNYNYSYKGYDYITGERIKSEKEIGIDILNALVKLHEKRTNEYIELYGYDTWEKMFKCPDWREREAEYDDSDEEDDNDYEEENEEDEY